MKRVGVISDTHGLMRPEALKALRGSDLILHAGDIGCAEVLQELGVIAPGKIADLTIVDGDPLKLIFNLMNVGVVVQGGKIVVDRR